MTDHVEAARTALQQLTDITDELEHERDMALLEAGRLRTELRTSETERIRLADHAHEANQAIAERDQLRTELQTRNAVYAHLINGRLTFNIEVNHAVTRRLAAVRNQIETELASLIGAHALPVQYIHAELERVRDAVDGLDTPEGLQAWAARPTQEDLDQARHRITILTDRLEASRADVTRYLAERDQARTQLEAAQAQVDRLTAAILDRIGNIPGGPLNDRLVTVAETLMAQLARITELDTGAQRNINELTVRLEAMRSLSDQRWTELETARTQLAMAQARIAAFETVQPETIREAHTTLDTLGVPPEGTVSNRITRLVDRTKQRGVDLTVTTWPDSEGDTP